MGSGELWPGIWCRQSPGGGRTTRGMKQFALGDCESLIISKRDLIHCSPKLLSRGRGRLPRRCPVRGEGESVPPDTMQFKPQHAWDGPVVSLPAFAQLLSPLRMLCLLQLVQSQSFFKTHLSPLFSFFLPHCQTWHQIAC